MTAGGTSVLTRESRGASLRLASRLARLAPDSCNENQRAMASGAGASSAAMDQSQGGQVYNYPLPTSTQHMMFSNKQTALRELQRAQKMHIDK